MVGRRKSRGLGLGSDRSREFLHPHRDALRGGNVLNMHPVFGWDVPVGQRPSAYRYRQDFNPPVLKFGVHGVGATEPFDEGFVVHDLSLSFVAPPRNMICSVAMCDSALMGDESLEAQGRRLKQARELAGYGSAAAFAHVVKVKPVTYRAYEAGQNGYAKLAHQFADKLGVDARWLLKGESSGPSGLELHPEREFEKAAQEMGLALIPQLELGYSMGAGSIFTEYNHLGFVPFQRDWLKGLMRGSFADLFVARGDGDSMQPTMLDGDIVLIDTAQKDIAQQDRIWALSYGELGMIKRVRRLPGGTYKLMSDNASVSPIDAADGEMYVVGRVVWIGRMI